MWSLLVLCSVIATYGVQATPTTAGLANLASTAGSATCRYNCGRDFGFCSCSSSCQHYGRCCPDYYSYCSSWTTKMSKTTTAATTTPIIDYPTCRYNCGRDFGFCSCSSSCQRYGRCCPDYYSYCASTTTPRPTSGSATCRYNCGRNFGFCSCSSSCQRYGSCCPDYYSYCASTTTPRPTSGYTSCRYKCGYNLGVCSCASSCQRYGNCCYDYHSYCPSTQTTTRPTTRTPGSATCRYNCGTDFGFCSCSSSCQRYGRCCPDYYSYCASTTTPRPTSGSATCRYNCGRNFGFCSCSSSCQRYGSCCPDYYSYCASTTTPRPTSGSATCRYNCGRNFGFCSCSSSCQRYGSCCPDYYSYCASTTTPRPTSGYTSCRYNCGYNLGVCSCASSCQRYGNCCYDYHSYCPSTQTTTRPTTRTPEYVTCRYNCGREWAVCSCASSCERYGNCCYDYNSYCAIVSTTPGYASCRYNCGYNLGVCSCASSCERYGNCCYDYYSYCPRTSTTPAPPCGGSLYGSGTFSSPNHPNHYHDSSYCVWYLKTSNDQRVFLSFLFVELENCCNCDYIYIYDGPSLNSRYLGKVCNSSLNSFTSSSNSMTVLFRSDSSVVARGFKAEFKSTLPPNSGRVNCSSDGMEIVIERSYLNSIGYDGYSLYLNDPNCRPSVTWSQVIFRYPLDSCGNIRKFQNGSAIYSNAVHANSQTSGEITRQSYFKLIVDCHMAKDSVSQNLYVIQNANDSSIIGSGRFNTTMRFYTNSAFHHIITESPYKVSLNQYLYVEVRLNRFDSSLILAFDNCLASPNKDDFHTRSYYLIRKGCEVDSTVGIVNRNTPYARFWFKAFQFLRASDYVYLQCKVLICDAQDYNSRCRRGCMKRRTRRNLGSEQASQTLVLGPIQLKEPEKNKDGTRELEKA